MDSILKKIKLLLLPKHRRIYVILHGRYKGEWWVQVSKEDPYKFFSLPDKYVREVNAKDFEEGLSKKILEPVDVLPKGVYNVCLAEYNLKATDEQRNNALNRWKQHNPSNSLDSK